MTMPGCRDTDLVLADREAQIRSSDLIDFQAHGLETAIDIVDPESLAVHGYDHSSFATIFLKQDLSQSLWVGKRKARVKTGQRDACSVVVRATRLGGYLDWKFLDVLYAPQILEAQGEGAPNAASACLQRHLRRGHEARKLADAFAALYQPLFADGSLTSRRPSICGNRKVVPAYLFCRHSGAAVRDDDRLI